MNRYLILSLFNLNDFTYVIFIHRLYINIEEPISSKVIQLKMIIMHVSQNMLDIFVNVARI